MHACVCVFVRVSIRSYVCTYVYVRMKELSMLVFDNRD